MSLFVPIVGIHGPAYSGKDTVAKFLLAQRGGYIYGFANPIRAMMKGLGIDMDDPYWIERKEQIIPALGVSPRRMMQTLGTEWGRNIISKDFWLSYALQEFSKCGPGMIVSDIRFDNEAKWIRERGGIIIRLQRDSAKQVLAHSSENGLTPHETDILLENNGSLEELQSKIAALCYEETREHVHSINP